MEKPSATDRRSFLKTGALLAAPVVAAAPVAALGADDSRAKLARLEDERAIEALQRRLVRHLNGAGDGREFAALDIGGLGDGLRSVAEHPAHEAALELAEDGLSARMRCACTAVRETEFTGDTTLERMARFQGQGSHRHGEERVLVAEFAKDTDGWRIATARFA